MTFEEGENKAKELGGIFMETSAMSGSNVKQLFKKIALTLPGTDSKDDSNHAPCKIYIILYPIKLYNFFCLDSEVILQNHAERQEASSKCAC